MKGWYFQSILMILKIWDGLYMIMHVIEPGCPKYADIPSDGSSLSSLSHLQMEENVQSGDLVSVYFNIIQNRIQIISYMTAGEIMWGLKAGGDKTM